MQQYVIYVNGERTATFSLMANVKKYINSPELVDIMNSFPKTEIVCVHEKTEQKIVYTETFMGRNIRSKAAQDLLTNI